MLLRRCLSSVVYNGHGVPHHGDDIGNGILDKTIADERIKLTKFSTDMTYNKPRYKCRTRRTRERSCNNGSGRKRVDEFIMV